MPTASLILPRPFEGEAWSGKEPLRAPSEASFVQAFGQRLPSASFMQTSWGAAAYYELPPSTSPPKNTPNPIERIVFVHGVQTPAIGMQPLASALQSRFPYAYCVLVDLWGHGLSDTPVVEFGPMRFHELIDSLIMTLNWDDAHFVGYSFGGSTVASFTALRSTLVKSMALVAPAGLLRQEELTDEQKGYMRGERVARGEIVAEAVRDWQMKNHEGHLPSVVAIFRDGGVFDQHDAFKEAAGKGIPNLCVLGELDALCSVQDLHDVGMQNVAVVPQVGHGVVRQKVSEVAQLIDDFWKSLEKGK
ncbi:hypothetical protein N7532_000610 [Penicillium argentinense]|uniref:AB hydrolase-1 domain-containing protein n=1 Tax=Penicillium argentinense TaxID=1131581 RepID=A0A9W9G6H4_9EURO|nr:uncharacterized protein N7532_000610 [Penicillium argentinense]KAJ5112565.1 hypothetical protein N7532_000610 [Penicillium argentinense]